MGLLAALTALLVATARVLELRILDYPQKLQDEIDFIEDQIDLLRAAGDPVSQLRADRLLARLARKRGYASTLPAPSPAPAAGSAGADTGRPVLPADH